MRMGFCMLYSLALVSPAGFEREAEWLLNGDTHELRVARWVPREARSGRWT